MSANILREIKATVKRAVRSTDLSPKFPPVLRGVLGVKSLALGRHFVHRRSRETRLIASRKSVSSPRRDEYRIVDRSTRNTSHARRWLT